MAVAILIFSKTGGGGGGGDLNKFFFLPEKKCYPSVIFNICPLKSPKNCEKVPVKNVFSQIKFSNIYANENNKKAAAVAKNQKIRSLKSKKIQ